MADTALISRALSIGTRHNEWAVPDKDYIDFLYEEFDRGCVVIVNKLPIAYNEDNLPVRCLKYLKTFNTQYTGQSGTRNVYIPA